MLFAPAQPSGDLAIVAVIIGIHISYSAGGGPLIHAATAPILEIKARPGIDARTHIAIWFVRWHPSELLFGVVREPFPTR